jgi:hypothetical protein
MGALLAFALGLVMLWLGSRTFAAANMDHPFNAQGAFIGDYNGIAVLNGPIYGVWT